MLCHIQFPKLLLLFLGFLFPSWHFTIAKLLQPCHLTHTSPCLLAVNLKSEKNPHFTHAHSYLFCSCFVCLSRLSSWPIFFLLSVLASCVSCSFRCFSFEKTLRCGFVFFSALLKYNWQNCKTFKVSILWQFDTHLHYERIPPNKLINTSRYKYRYRWEHLSSTLLTNFNIRFYSNCHRKTVEGSGRFSVVMTWFGLYVGEVPLATGFGVGALAWIASQHNEMPQPITKIQKAGTEKAWTARDPDRKTHIS